MPTYPSHVAGIIGYIFSPLLKNKQTARYQWLTDIFNPNYSGGRDQEDGCLKRAWANNSRDSISKIPNPKKGLAEWLQ
jgi:hypothetical protein